MYVFELKYQIFVQYRFKMCVAQSRGNEMYKSNKQQTKITSDVEKTHEKYLFLFMFQCSIIQPAKDSRSIY